MSILAKMMNRFDAAQRRGVEDGVAVFFSMDSWHARRAYGFPSRKIKRKDMVKDKGECGMIDVLPRHEAGDLLREFAGQAGQIIAGELELVPRLPFIGVWIDADCLSLVTYDRRRFTEQVLVGYAYVVMRLRRGGRPNGTGFSQMYCLMGPNGEFVPVGGRNANDSRAAAYLASTILSRRTVCQTAFNMLSMQCITHLEKIDLVAELLPTGNPPHVIAEAIRVLRRMGSGAERALLEIMARRPELYEVARQVDFELTGEQPKSGALPRASRRAPSVDRTELPAKTRQDGRTRRGKKKGR